MKKGQLSVKMTKRLPVIDRFVKRNKRLPTNSEIREMFDIAPGGIGETTKHIIDCYVESRKTCSVCGHEL